MQPEGGRQILAMSPNASPAVCRSVKPAGADTSPVSPCGGVTHLTGPILVYDSQDCTIEQRPELHSERKAGKISAGLLCIADRNLPAR